jgi:putative phosphoribosyl transferase
MGAVAEDGRLFLNQDVVGEMGVTEAFIQQEKAVQLAEIKRREGLFRRVRPKVPLQGRTVIITDDGVATGATTQAAFWAARLEQPEKLVAAIPVGPPDTITRLAGDVDEMLCLRAPSFFEAVGQFYIHFFSIEDEEVLAILKEEAGRKSVKS